MRKISNTNQFDKCGHYRKDSIIKNIPINHENGKTPKMKMDEFQRKIIRNIMENEIKKSIVSKEELINVLISNTKIAEHFSYYTAAGQDLKEIFGNWYDAIKNKIELRKEKEEEGIEIE